MKRAKVVASKQGRKPDVAKIKSAVNKTWSKMDSAIRKALADNLPTRKSEAKKHVLRVASGIIATKIRTRRSASHGR